MHAWTEVLETHWTGSPLTEVSSSDHKPSIVKKDAEIGHSRTVTFPFKEQVDNRIVCENTKTLRSALAPLHDVVDRVMDLQAPFPGSLTYPGGSLLDHQVTEIWVPTRRGQTACLPLMSSHSWVTRSLADVSNFQAPELGQIAPAGPRQVAGPRWERRPVRPHKVELVVTKRPGPDTDTGERHGKRCPGMTEYHAISCHKSIALVLCCFCFG